MAAEEDTPPKGTDRTGTRRDRPPVTIDLEAETAAAPEAPEDAPPASPANADQSAAGRRPGVSVLVLAGVAGGVVVAVLGYGLQMAGVVPAPGQAEATQTRAEISELNDTLTALDQRVTNIEAANAQSIADRALLDDLSRQVGVVDAFGTSLSDRLLTAEASIAALEDGSGGDDPDRDQVIDSLSKRVTRLETMPAPADSNGPSAAMEEMDQRIQTLESGLAKLATAAAPEPNAAAPPPRQDSGAPSTTVIAALKQAAAGSEPFATELAKLDDRDITAATRAALAPLAETGVPTQAELVAAFPTVASAIVSGEPTSDAGDGFFDRLASYGRNLVTVRTTGSQSGGGPAAIVSQMRAAVAAGDLAKALAERKALPAQGHASSQEWAAAVANRLEIERLLGEISDTPNAGADSG